MSKKMVLAISAVAAALLLVGALVLIFSRGGGEATEAEGPRPTASTSQTTTVAGISNPVAVLESAAANSIHPAPAPAAPETWGDYQVRQSWEGTVRLSPISTLQRISGKDGGELLVSTGDCEFTVYLVTFRPAQDGVDIQALLLDATGEVVTEEEINDGWSLSTHCEIPAYEFLSSEDGSVLGDVDYTVHEYRRTSTTVEVPTASPTMQPVEPTPQVIEPVLVQCLGYLGPAMGLYSDGSERLAPECEGSPEQQRSVKAEGICGGLYGWLEVSAAEYRDLCGIEPPTDRAPIPATPADPVYPESQNDPAPTVTPTGAVEVLPGLEIEFQ